MNVILTSPTCTSELLYMHTYNIYMVGNPKYSRSQSDVKCIPILFVVNFLCSKNTTTATVDPNGKRNKNQDFTVLGVRLS